jgi:8-amino-7-oxononanoate synthase
MLIPKLHQKLLERAENNSLRKLTVTKGLIDFYSNDYLGLGKSESLSTLIHQECINQKGNTNGSTGSRLLSGNSEYALKLEDNLSILFKSEKALLMNSGYNANLSVLASIPQKGDTIIYDELIHASLKDGYRLSFAHRFPFKHNDLADLEAKLKKGKGAVFIVIESIYSMDGDCAPLKEIVELSTKYGAHIILDEAHSTGTLGLEGNGLACQLNLEQKIFARIYTFGKAMGVHGACVVGSKILIDYLINFARPFIYTTALPLHSLASIHCSFQFLKENIHLQEQLQEQISRFKLGLGEEIITSGNYIESKSPIQVIKLNNNENVKNASELLKITKLDVRPILYPTVKEGEERLRICLHTYNTHDEIDLLTHTLNTIL